MSAPKLNIPTPGTSTIAGSAPRIGGESGVGVPLVVGAVVLAVGGVQLAQPFEHVLERRGRRQVEHQRPDLGAQEVVRARRAERGQRRVLAPGEEVEHDAGLSLKCPTCARSVEASPRITGARAAARARRSAAGSGS